MKYREKEGPLDEYGYLKPNYFLPDPHHRCFPLLQDRREGIMAIYLNDIMPKDLKKTPLTDFTKRMEQKACELIKNSVPKIIDSFLDNVLMQAVREMDEELDKKLSAEEDEDDIETVVSAYDEITLEDGDNTPPIAERSKVSSFRKVVAEARVINGEEFLAVTMVDEVAMVNKNDPNPILPIIGLDLIGSNLL